MTTQNKRLEEARLQRRWSVEVASGKVGVSVNTFNRWERGIQVPQLETLDLLCKAFDMDPEALGFANVITAKRRAKLPSAERTTNNTSITLPCISAPLTAFSQPSSGEMSTRQESYSPLDPLVNRCLIQTRRSFDDMHSAFHTPSSNTWVSRRKAVTLLIGAPALVFGLAHNKHTIALHPEEVIALSTVNIPLCWQLYFEGGLSELEDLLPSYLAQITALAQELSPYQQRAAHLASQAHQLGYLLTLQRQNFGKSLIHTQEAARYAQIAADVNLQLASVVRQAYVYFCLKRTEQRLHTYQQALPYCSECSPLLQGYLYAGLAETHAMRQEKQLALEYFQRALAVFPDRPEEDPNFSYTHFRWLTIYNLEGLMYLHLQQPQQAWSAFEKVDQATPAGSVPYRVEINVHKAATSFALGDMEHMCSLLTSAVTGATELGSSLRYDEACTVYDQAQTQWKQEAPIKALSELFSRKQPF